jgi:Outer membrane protein beta-barrel domain
MLKSVFPNKILKRMKIFNFLFIVLSFTVQVSAQSRVSVGVIGGPMAADFKSSPNSFLPKKIMPAFSLGTAFRIKLENHLFLQTDISYERKGYSLGELEFTDFNGVVIEKLTIHNQFNYGLLTPTIGLTVGEKMRFECSVGVFGGYLIDMKSVSATSLFGTSKLEGQGTIDGFNRLDFGLAGRIGVGFDISKKFIVSVNAIGNFGIAKPYRPIDINTLSGSLDDQTRSFGVQLGLFYKINDPSVISRKNTEG